MSQPTGVPHTWAITGQQEEPTIDEDGQATSVHHVSFRTNTGHESSVAIPNEQFNAANVARAVTAKAAHINAVHSMNSTNAPTEAA